MAERWVVNASPLILLGKAGILPLLPSLCDELISWNGGAGEAEVISWALAQREFVGVHDDQAARRLAMRHGVTVIGSLRVIVKAKERGLISLARPVLEKLRGSGAYVSDELIDRAIGLAGE